MQCYALAYHMLFEFCLSEFLAGIYHYHQSRLFKKKSSLFDKLATCLGKLLVIKQKFC